MSLSDSFPSEFKNDFAERNLKPGAVIRLFVRNTTPPKEKILILVSESYDKLVFAAVFINSKINPRIFPTRELQSLHIPVYPDSLEFLSHNSFIDCSQIHAKNRSELLSLIQIDPAICKGHISQDQLKDIKSKIQQAPTISNAEKKRFGLFY